MHQVKKSQSVYEAQLLLGGVSSLLPSLMHVEAHPQLLAGCSLYLRCIAFGQSKPNRLRLMRPNWPDRM